MENIKTPKIGMGVTVTLYTDRVVYTITRVSPTGKSFWAKPDKATLDPNWKSDFIPGGFCGHVANNHTQKYSYETDHDAPEVMFRLTKKSQWSKKGNKRVTLDCRSFFYDYNF